ncbi:hypothetical protein AOLI_G00012280 [Acnodon oligacanthus]
MLCSCISNTFTQNLQQCYSALSWINSHLLLICGEKLRLFYLMGKANELSQIHDGEPSRNYTSQSAVRVTSATLRDRRR